MYKGEQPYSLPPPVALKTIITAQLDQILGSSVFKAAGSLQELLRFTVHETLEGRGYKLKEYLLGVAVLGKKDSFDPKIDPIVRVQMGRLRERLNKYYAAEGRYDTLLIQIPKGTYRPIFHGAAQDAALEALPVVEDRLMVGRQRELAELNAAFSSAAAGCGRWFCLAGEPGIGKTTVVEMFLRQLSASGVTCYLARGRCSERLAGSEAYLPVLETLESFLRDQELARLMSAVAPTWYVQVAPLTEGPLAERILAKSKMASQQRLKRELAAFLEEVAHRQTVVLFFDDMHWADASTIDVLAYIGTRCSSQRILIVCAYRSEELFASNHPFMNVKLELQGHGFCRERRMQFLTMADVDAYLALRFPEHLFPSELSAHIHNKTEGNPLFMADLVRFLQDRGLFAQQDGRWVMAGQLSAVELELPESVRSMVQKKIDQLDDLDRRVMSAAAVQGEEFESAVVAKALDMSAAQVEAQLEALDRMQGLVFLIGDRELPDSTLTLRYRFVHVLYQNALHNTLTATRRAVLSLAVAEAILEFYRGQMNQVAAQLGLLLETARDFRRASDFFLVAVQNAAQLYAAEEAVTLARRAIANAEKLEGPDRYSRLMAAALNSAEQYTCLAQFDKALADFDLADRAAEKLADPEAQISAIYARALTLFVAKQLPEVKQQGVRARQLAAISGSAFVAATSDAILAMERSCAGDVAVALEQFDRAVPVLRDEALPRQAIATVCVRGGLHSLRLEHEEANLDFNWVRDQGGRAGQTFVVLEALLHQGRTRGNQGRLSDAWKILEEALQLAELLGDVVWRPRIANTRAWILAELLDTEAAVPLNVEAASLAGELGDLESECNSHINAARDYLTLGEPQHAWQHLQQADAQHRVDTWFPWIYYPRLLAETASYWIARGDLSMALSNARSSLEHAERTLNRKRMAWAHKLLGEIAVLSDRPDDARTKFGAALHLLEHHRCPTIEWQILKPAAAAATMLGDGSAHDELLGRARAVVQTLADSVRDDARRRKFLRSKTIRDLSA